MPPAAVASAKFLVSYTVNGTPVAKRDSLIGAGPLKVQMENYFAKEGSTCGAYVPALGGGEQGIDLRKIEFVVLDSLDWSEALMARDLRWSISAARITRLLQALDDTRELDWAPVDGIDQLKSGLVIRQTMMSVAPIRLSAWLYGPKIGSMACTKWLKVVPTPCRPS